VSDLRDDPDGQNRDPRRRRQQVHRGRAFANGGSSLTGIEAVSNAVSALRPPEGRNARQLLVTQGAIVAFLIAGISWLAHITHAVPYVNGFPTVLSQEAKLIFGPSAAGRLLYFLVQAGAISILFTGGNTSFSGFPFLTSFVAEDSFLPRWLSKRGHRLVFSNGIIVLTVLALALLLAVGANTNNLVPFYAIGVFTGFAMAGFGMARYHRKTKEPGWRRRRVINFTAGVAARRHPDLLTDQQPPGHRGRPGAHRRIPAGGRQFRPRLHRYRHQRRAHRPVLRAHPHHRPPARQQRQAPRRSWHHQLWCCHDQPSLRTTRLTSFGPPLHETACPGVERLQGGSEILLCLFTFRVQVGSFEDSPVAYQRHDHIVVVDAQVVDARLGDLRGLAGKAGDDTARHHEADDLVGDGPEGLARRDLQRGPDQVTVEDHVQVLVHRDPGEQILRDGVFAVTAGVTVRNASGEFLEGHVGAGVEHRLVPGIPPRLQGRHPGPFEALRIDPTGNQ
jgi:hypothetical protein